MKNEGVIVPKLATPKCIKRLRRKKLSASRPTLIIYVKEKISVSF